MKSLQWISLLDITLPNVEQVKAFAAVVQAVGVMVAAFLAYQLGRKLEEHKFNMRIKEIVHANTHKREQESLERLVKLMANMTFKLGLVPPFFNDPEPVPERTDGESFEQWHARRYPIKVGAFNASILELNQAEEEASIYLPSEIQEKLEAFRRRAICVLDVYFKEIESKAEIFQALQRFKDDLKDLREERKMIVEVFKNQLMRLK